MNDGKETLERRLTADDISGEVRSFSEELFPGSLFDAVPNIFLLLNETRQVIFANKAAFDLFRNEVKETVYGLRPGEALRCVYSACSADGCGTSEFCVQCGANAAIRGSLTGKREARECNLLRVNDRGDIEALDLLVWSTPHEFDGKRYAAFSVMDISHQKRRRVLESIFFHDIINIAGGLQTYSEFLSRSNEAATPDTMAMLHEIIKKLVNEILAQRDLTAAENDELVVNPTPFDTTMFLDEVAETWRKHDSARDKTVEVDCGAEDVKIVTDLRLLERVIGNMVKNALEFSLKGDTITLSACMAGDRIELRVKNPGVIPPEIQKRIFHRFFSTKGKNRGMGTYSMKLIGERYLKGKVSFVSGPETGTVFYIRLPQEI